MNNRYQIIQALSSGGFGETFLAQDTQMPSGRYCVIKQLKVVTNNPEIYQQVLQRFQREAAILEELGETNSQIPKLYAYFSDTAGQFYLVQEWIEGETLGKRVKTKGPMTDGDVQKILISLLSVINYIHSRNIIHRDIKPENIILRQQDDLPVLIDFGAVKDSISTAINSQNTTPISIMIGTPGYMAFEQAAGRPVYASDLYSLGLTAIFLLTGRVPQDLDMDLQTGKIIWQKYTNNLTPKLAGILDKAIQPNISDRFAKSTEMLSALESDSTQVFSNEKTQPSSSLVVINNPDATTTLNSPLDQSLDHPSTQLSINRKTWQKAAIISGVIGSCFLSSILLKNVLSKSPQTGSEIPKFPTPPTTELVKSISQQQAEELIQNWLKAKKEIFAPPYNQKLAAELTTGKVYDNIVASDGAIVWLKENNAYYQYKVQKIDSIEYFSTQGNQATIQVKVTEEYKLFKNDKLDATRSGFAQLTVIYNLIFIDGKWKIATSEII
ncbi:IMS domain-containing protein [Okeania sp. SIO3B5]|uniref:protein kinase domain-containing protein n=1 Tax=Okeania sp. SIO3B5 TaxID=2607811 RepID=UPI0025E43422|nr:IMS domain-containing protein [Okeania sp. SIO3B5]